MGDDLRTQVLRANLDLVSQQLVILTWGNVSGIDRSQGRIFIKPSGVPYDRLTPEMMVETDTDGRPVSGKLKPSSDLKTHVHLYRAFPDIGAVCHTHSTFATSFAQAGKEIVCLGTTHADYFGREIPVTRFLTEGEMEQYEQNTGMIISERFADLDPAATPAVLVAGHAPFTWGKDAMESVQHSLILERVAEMAFYTQNLNPGVQSLPEHIRQKHYSRKHGPDAYYGQNR
jgi:L-ribulose-5-phosphate 4-epimerase